MPSTRQLAAIMFTDIVGYTALMGKDEQKAIELLEKNRQLQRPIVEAHNGNWIKELGDGVMMCFDTVTDAVAAAIDIQQQCNETREFQLRIGIHSGEVVFENNDVFGDGVNIASRIQSIASPGSVFVSEAVYENISNKNSIQTRFVREELLKNVTKPVPIYEIIITNDQAPLLSIVATSEKSIAVLPFRNMSSDPEQEYFSDGITEEIITELSHLRDLLVISRSSVMTFKDSKKKITEIAYELNVKHVLEGSVRKSGNQLRITAQLINAAKDAQVWADKYAGTLDDVFDIQERVARAIVSALRIELTTAENNRMADRPIADPKAYDLWIQAMYEFRKFSGSGVNKGIMLLKRALETEGDNARLYSSLAYLYWAAYDFGIDYNNETLKQVELYSNKALSLDPSMPHALFAKALLCYKSGDMKGFITYAGSAVKSGVDSDSLCMYSFVLGETGQTDLARSYSDNLLVSNPLTFLPWWARASVDLFDGKADEAYARIRNARDKMSPGEPFAGWWVAQMAAYAGKQDQAHEEFKRVASTNNGLWTDFCELFKRALENDRNAVLDQIKITKLADFAQTDEYYPIFLANALSLVGEYEEAINWIARAIKWGFSNYRFLVEGNRFLVPLHNKPRFQELIKSASQQQKSLIS